MCLGRRLCNGPLTCRFCVAYGQGLSSSRAEDSANDAKQLQRKRSWQESLDLRREQFESPAVSCTERVSFKRLQSSASMCMAYLCSARVKILLAVWLTPRPCLGDD